MAEEMNMMGEQPPMPSQEEMQIATQNLMSSDADIQAVLMSRISQMTPDELKALDSAVTPEVASALTKLLPELQELIDVLGQQGEMPENMEAPMSEEDTSGMPKDMGALGSM